MEQMQQVVVFRKNRQASKLSILQCKQGKSVIRLCCSAKCEQSGLLCNDYKCECNKLAHKWCSNLVLEHFCQQIDQRRGKIPQSALKSFQAIDKIIEDMLEELSIIRESIQKQKDNYGLQQNTLQFLILLNGKESDKINGKLVSSMQSQLSEPKESYYASQNEINSTWKQKKQNFDKLCSWLKEISDRNWWKSEINNQFPVLYGWIKQSMDKDVKSHKLLYRATENDFSAQKFHQKCDNIPNTLVIVRTEFGKIIGGFNPAMWTSSYPSTWHSESRAFIFSLSLKEKITNINTTCSILCSSNCGPIFGVDLLIHNQANVNQNSFSEFPESYNCQGKYVRSQETHTLFTGATSGNKFKIEQWEVFQIDF